MEIATKDIKGIIRWFSQYPDTLDDFFLESLSKKAKRGYEWDGTTEEAELADAENDEMEKQWAKATIIEKFSLLCEWSNNWAREERKREKKGAYK